MDEIAVAAGLTRSTLYLHYRDKAEILREVISDYAPKAQAALANLPGPRPKLDAIARWVKSVSKFVAKERVPLSIIVELRRDPDTMATLEDLTEGLLLGLGQNNAPFREAANRDARPGLRARALMLLQELTFACEYYLDDTESSLGSALLQVTARDFHQFLTAPAVVGAD